MVKSIKHKFNLFHATHIKPHHGNKKLTGAIDSSVASIALVASLLALPQVLKVYATHNVSSLSAITYIAALLASFAWLIYGIFYKSKPVLLSSGLNVTVNALMVMSFIIFR